MEEIETIIGFDIPKRELTEEEKSREITIERIRDFHYTVGEDFLDQTSLGDAKIFAGFIAHKYPDKAKDIYKINNCKGIYLTIASFTDLFSFNEDEDIKGLYFEFVEFANTTSYLKEYINQVLIQVDEFYRD